MKAWALPYLSSIWFRNKCNVVVFYILIVAIAVIVFIVATVSLQLSCRDNVIISELSLHVTKEYVRTNCDKFSHFCNSWLHFILLKNQYILSYLFLIVIQNNDLNPNDNLDMIHKIFKDNQKLFPKHMRILIFIIYVTGQCKFICTIIFSGRENLLL